MRKQLFIKMGVILAAAMFLITSCYEDKGNYDYKTINEITFPDIAESYIIAYGEPLVIRPTLVQTVYNNEDNYEYAWLNLGSAGQTVIDTLHKERNIDSIVLDKLKIGNNTIVYQVYDRTHNVKYTSQYFNIEVGNDIKQGFMLLLNNEGETDLRFLNYNPSYNGGAKIDMRSVSLTSIPELGAPVAIACFIHPQSPLPGGFGYTAAGITNQTVGIYAISLITETGFYRLNPADHRYEEVMNGKYIIAGDWTDFNITGIYDATDRSYTNQYGAMIRDGNGNFMYHKAGAGAALTIIPWVVGTYCNRYAIKDGTGKITSYQRFTPFEYFGFLRTSSGIAVFFDMDSRSFVYKSGTSGADNYCQRFTAEETLFKFNNNVSTFEPQWLFTRTSDSQINGTSMITSYAVVKNTGTGSIDMLLFGSANAATSPQKIMKLYPQTDGGKTLLQINNAKRYAMHLSGSGNWRSLFFYATDTEIYVYDIVDGTNKKVFPLEGDETGRQIVEMKFNITQNTGNNAFANNLIIATKGSGENSTNVGIYYVKENDGELSVRTLTNTVDGVIQCLWKGLPDYVGIDWKAKP